MTSATGATDDSSTGAGAGTDLATSSTIGATVPPTAGRSATTATTGASGDGWTGVSGVVVPPLGADPVGSVAELAPAAQVVPVPVPAVPSPLSR